MIRGILLDVDDTLVDTRTAFAAGIAAVVARWLPHLAPAEQEAALRHWVSDAEGELIWAAHPRPVEFSGGTGPCHSRGLYPHGVWCNWQHD